MVEVQHVAVIGAGAAGLVTSRHLLRCGLRPRIFEQSRAIGGAWSCRGRPRKMWDSLTPNLSRYTCCFSDFPWPAQGPTFPSLADMNQYLEDYASTFVENDCFRFGCTVTQIGRVRRRNTGGSASPQREKEQYAYKVEWTEDDGTVQSQEFDGVVVASGFFSTPFFPKGVLSFTEEGRDDVTSPPIEDVVLHSAEYRSPDAFRNKTVAVVGSSFSAHEIAVDVRRRAKRVVNVLPSIPWVVPRYLPLHSDRDDSTARQAPAFLPVDVVLYQRTEGDAPQTPETISLDKEGCRRRHEHLLELVGTRKQQEAIGLPDMDSPPLVSISDHYLDFVRDGKIGVVHGRLARVRRGTTAVDIELEDGTVVSGIDHIIACTGYRTNLDFLEPDISEKLEYDETDGFSPLTLCYDTFHPDLPGLYFVGMYKGPYFGVMELQARLVAGLLSGEVRPAEDTVSNALDASRKIRDHKPRAQFPHFDYIGFMDSLGSLLELAPSKEKFGARGMMVAPAFYQTSDEIAQRCKNELEEEYRGAAEEGRNVARLALSALIGRWSFERTITEFSTSSSPQRVVGNIVFSVHGPRLDTVLYREDGHLELPTGNTIQVFREYEYLLSDDGALEIYFIEEGKRAHLFLSLKFTRAEDGYWVASNDHLCVADLYKGTFKIAFDGIGATEIRMTYRVKGPNKDYESVTILKPSEGNQVPSSHR